MKNEANKLLSSIKQCFLAVRFQLLLLIMVAIIYFVSKNLLIIYNNSGLLTIKPIIYTLLQIIIILTSYWIIIRIIHFIEQNFKNNVKPQNFTVALIILPIISLSARIIVTIGFFNLLFGMIAIPAQYIKLVEKGSAIMIILVVGWVLFKLVSVIENYLAQRYQLKNDSDLSTAKTSTQIMILKRIINFGIGILILGAILMLFDNIRQFGMSVLASAGIAGVIIGFAAQKTLGNLFLSLQLAMYSPIKLNDYVIIENEFGQIEEITLNYIVIKIWDLRRLILPISYFMDKPIQNLSRKSMNILGTVFLYVDYTLSVPKLRMELQKIIQNNPLWDNQVSTLQVTDAKENTMEIRILVSAVNPSKLWDLRCDIREKLLSYIREQYPQALPQTRITLPHTLVSAN